MPYTELPKDLSIEDIVESIEEGEHSGFCLHCGEDSYNIEPDAREYSCECCGREALYGAEELLIMFQHLVK